MGGIEHMWSKRCVCYKISRGSKYVIPNLGERPRREGGCEKVLTIGTKTKPKGLERKVLI